MTQDPEPIARRLLRGAAWLAFPVLLWMLATLFLGGDLGKSSDDYAINLRDPVTNEAPGFAAVLTPYKYFWRPLHLVITFAAGTYLSDSFRVLHVSCAGLHALVAAGVYALSRRGGVHKGLAIVGSIGFLAMPIHAEAVFWFSTVSTLISAGLYIGVLLWMCGLAISNKREAKLRTVHCVLIFELTFVLGCLFEQSMAATAALPLFWIALRVGVAEAGTAVREAMKIGVSCVCAGALYAALIIVTAPGDVRGGAASFTPLDELGARVASWASSATGVLYGDHARDMTLGGIANAWGVLASPAGVVWGGLLGASLLTFVVPLATHDRNVERDASARASVSLRSAHRGFWLLALVVAAAASWIPVIAVRDQIVQDRLWYFALVMLWPALCLCLHRVIAMLGSVVVQRVVITAIATLACAGATLGAVGLVGSQIAYQRRWRLDQRIATSLREQVPSPHPDTVFLPLRMRDLATRTGHMVFDSVPLGAMETTWSATDQVQRLYRTPRMWGVGSTKWLPPFVERANEHGLVLATHLRIDKFDRHVAWNQLVPYVISEEGDVRLVRRLTIEQPDGSDLVIVPPQVRSALKAEHGQFPAAIATTWVEDIASMAGVSSLEGWRWKSGGAVSFPHLPIWDGRRRAQWMHPSGLRGAINEMRLSVAASSQPRRVAIRATVSEEELDRIAVMNRPVQPMRLQLSRLGSGTLEYVLGSVQIDGRAIRKRRGWLALIADIPASSEPIQLVLRIEGIDAANKPVVAEMPSVCVTPGCVWSSAYNASPEITP